MIKFREALFSSRFTSNLIIISLLVFSLCSVIQMDDALGATPLISFLIGLQSIILYKDYYCTKKEIADRAKLQAIKLKLEALTEAQKNSL